MNLLTLGQSLVLQVTQRGYLALPSVLAAYRDPCLSYNVALKHKLSPSSDAQLQKQGSGPSLQETVHGGGTERCSVLTLQFRGSLRYNVKGNFDNSRFHPMY